MSNAITKVVLTNIEYDTDGEIVNGLPSHYTVNLKRPTNHEEDALTMAMDALCDDTGWCIMNCNPTYHRDNK